MHVLVVNDDGPPSQLSSPYVHSFVNELKKSGAAVSVCLPHTQRSWIGKAHIPHTVIKPTYFRPGTLHKDDGTTHVRPRTDGGEEWVLVDGTPATCVQIGLYHYFQDKGPIDLVVSGPNYGKNSTAVFSLSSGTIGGALEAAICQKKAIALSYAFKSQRQDPNKIREASQLSVRLVRHLCENWPPEVHLYTINVPLAINHAEAKIFYTNILQNYWNNGSSYKEIEQDETEESESELSENTENVQSCDGIEQKGHRHRHFRWAPPFRDISRSVSISPPGNDGWTVKSGYVSVTPLKANFLHATGFEGEIKLPGNDCTHCPPVNMGQTIYAIVNYEDDYVQPKIIKALQSRIPAVRFLPSLQEVACQGNSKVLQWSAYESIDFDHLIDHPTTDLGCTYIIRKAIIRKHYLAHTIRSYCVKQPHSVLSTAFPETHALELDYAEYLDEALLEAYELQASLEANVEKASEHREWWILKPSMSDRGQGIRLFSTTDELRAVFEGFEEEQEDDEDEDEDEKCAEKICAIGLNDGYGLGNGKPDTSVITNQMRHFIAQKYIHPPLLISDRKFHIRTYVLAKGSLSVFVYKPMLALLAGPKYRPPWEVDNTDLSCVLTNTCLQTEQQEESVRQFWDLEKDVHGGKDVLQYIFSKLCKITGEVFEAAAREQRVHFQTIPNSFEIFGVDFLVSQDSNVSLLEVNSYPDFRQTGEQLGGLIDGLFEAVVDTAVIPFFNSAIEVRNENMVKVCEIELGIF